MLLLFKVWDPINLKFKKIKEAIIKLFHFKTNIYDYISVCKGVPEWVHACVCVSCICTFDCWAFFSRDGRRIDYSKGVCFGVGGCVWVVSD